MPGCSRRHRGLLGSGNDISFSGSYVSSQIPSSTRNGFAFDELISIVIKLLHQIRHLVKPGTLPASNLPSGRFLKPTCGGWTRQLKYYRSLKDVFELAVTAEAEDTIATTYVEALKAKEIKSRELLTAFITIAPQASPPTAAELQGACQKLQSEVCSMVHDMHG
jgi:hypothetical protein